MEHLVLFYSLYRFQEYVTALVLSLRLSGSISLFILRNRFFTNRTKCTLFEGEINWEFLAMFLSALTFLVYIYLGSTSYGRVTAAKIGTDDMKAT